MRKTWAAAAVILLTLLPLVVQTWVVGRTGFMMGDFHAFYCAARVASQGRDPYRTEPLRSCEVSSGLRFDYSKHREAAVPAPLPPYAIAAIVPLAHLPLTIAALLWAGLLFGAGFVCVGAIVKFAGVTWQTTVAALSLSLGASSIPFGEVVPIAVAAICAAALFAQQKRWRAAGVAAAVSMIEPHIGLPLCVALFVWAPATRSTIAIAGGLLGAVGLVALGPATNLEYFLRVLPAHAISEAARDTQYSLTSILSSLGVADITAVRAGSVWYLGMLVAGVLFAGALSKRTGNTAFLACIPPAFAVFGGAFIHVTQIAAAIPATLLLLPSATRERRAMFVLALLLLAVPWRMAVLPSVAVAPLFPVAYLAWSQWNRNLRVAMIAAIAAGVLLIGITVLGRSVQPARPYVGTTIDADLAEATWSEYSREQTADGVAVWVTRIPTWAGLLILLIGVQSSVGFGLIGRKTDAAPELV